MLPKRKAHSGNSCAESYVQQLTKISKSRISRGGEGSCLARNFPGRDLLKAVGLNYGDTRRVMLSCNRKMALA